MTRIVRRMIGHGAVVMLFALAAGFGLAMSLVGGFEVLPGNILEFELPGDSRAWARTHVGGLLNGLLVMIGALVIQALHVPERSGRHLAWMLVGTGYANTIFYWGGLLSANRALTFGDNRYGEGDLMSVIGLLPALVFAFVSMVAMVIIARHAFSGDTADGSS